MLDPRDRRTLLDALRPPAGCVFDRAVGTSFSLDPTALLAVPLALAAFDLRGQDEEVHADSLALLEAIRRCAGHVSVFCQAGRISVPVHYRSLLTYLEGSVIEVTPPRDGFVFHPKVWAVRYVAGDEVMYRILCGTRNLTLDRSWDTMLVLDGWLTGRKNAIASNRPLSGFFAALPELALRESAPRVAADVALVADELLRVRFELPLGFDSVEFVPLGLSGRRSWPFPEAGTRGLVVSPFLADGFLQRLPTCRDGCMLVSRDESLLDVAPNVLAGFDGIKVLAEEAHIAESAAEGDTTRETLSGLHAKLFIIDEGWRSRVWTGSANATNAAFGGNVEFLVALAGQRAACGVAAVLRGERDQGLVSLLEDFQPPADPLPVDSLARELEGRLNAARTALAGRRLRVSVSPGSRRDVFRVGLTDEGGGFTPPGDVKVRAWPVSLPQDRAAVCAWGDSAVCAFGEVSFEAITPFVAFEVAVERDERRESQTFVLNLPLDGAPEGRETLVLRQMLRRPQDLIALLLLLLADDDLAVLDALLGDGGKDGATVAWTGSSARGLTEALVRQLGRDPHKLAAVKRLVAELQGVGIASGERTSAEAVDDLGIEVSVIPPGFDEVWEPIWAAAVLLGVTDD